MTKVIYINVDWLFGLLVATSWGYYLIFYGIPALFIMCKNKYNKKNKIGGNKLPTHTEQQFLNPINI